MKILDGIRTLLPCADRTAGFDGCVAVVDGQSLMRSQGGDRSAHPRDKVALLKRLATFAEKEQIAVTTLFSGSPLREAGDDEKYRGVVVRYMDEDADTAASILRILKENGIRKRAVVITADRDVDRSFSTAGVQVMLASTLRKALETTEPQPVRHNTHSQAQPEVEEDNDRIVKELIDPL